MKNEEKGGEGREGRGGPRDGTDIKRLRQCAGALVGLIEKLLDVDPGTEARFRPHVSYARAADDIHVYVEDTASDMVPVSGRLTLMLSPADRRLVGVVIHKASNLLGVEHRKPCIETEFIRAFPETQETWTQWPGWVRTTTDEAGGAS